MQDSPTPVGIHLIVVLVGNTSVHVARAEGVTITDHSVFPISALEEAVGAVATLGDLPVIVASVNESVSHDLIDRLIGDDRVMGEIHRIGPDLPCSVASSLPASAGTGQDRLLAAEGAYDLLGQACVVVDAGTAITVDFVDGEGVFQGGAILPGLRMSLRALHQGAPALPEIDLNVPDEAEPFGKDTRQAMLNGVLYGVRGAVRLLTERYAERYGAYPAVIATGGDAQLLFADDELIDRVVPDLVLRGIALAYKAALTEAE